MRIQYKKINFNGKSRQIITWANAIIEKYNGQGLSITLRQLYYRFVAMGKIPNTLRSYKNLGALISDARLAGFIDWNAITDRTRSLRGFGHHDKAEDAIEDAARNFFMDWHKNQPQRIEVWVEKDALVDVISKACRPYHVDFFSCRGYTSQSGLHEAAMRHKMYQDGGQRSLIIHLGDHDPSGQDMTRDIAERFELFGVDLEIDRIALNMDQVKRWNPPPNPAKKTDSRYDRYREKYGKNCWELDALEPEVIVKLVQRRIEKEIDQKALAEMHRLEDIQRDRMKLAAKRLSEGDYDKRPKPKVIIKTVVKKSVKTVFKTKIKWKVKPCKVCAKRKKAALKKKKLSKKKR